MPESPLNPVLLPVPWEDFFSHGLLPMGVLSRNGDDARFVKANAASAAQVGRDPSEVAGRSALELGIPPALVQAWLMSLQAAHQLGKPMDVRWQLASNYGLRSFTTRLLPFPLADEPMQHFGYISQEWTGAATAPLDDMLERERLAGALAAALAEEVEAPLQQLLGLMGVVADEVGALADSNPELELQECGRVLAIAMLLARTAHQPIHELREFLRPVASSPGPVDAGACLESALRLAGSQVKRSCAVRTEPMLSALVHADEPRLRHALIRVLLETARGPGPSYARVGDLLLSMTTDDRRLELVITRTDRCPTPQGDLATCEALVHRAGGTLRVEPWVGTGFRVRISLPLLQME